MKFIPTFITGALIVAAIKVPQIAGALWLPAEGTERPWVLVYAMQWLIGVMCLGCLAGAAAFLFMLAVGVKDFYDSVDQWWERRK